MTTNEDRAVVTAHNAGDVIGALPALFGFVPTESLCVLSLNGERQRVGFSARIDIPPVRYADEVARTIVGHMERNGNPEGEGKPDGALVVGLSTTREDDARLLVLTITEALVDAGIAVQCSAYANDTHVWEVTNPYLEPMQYRALGEAVAVALDKGMPVHTSRETMVNANAPLDNALAKSTSAKIGTIIEVAPPEDADKRALRALEKLREGKPLTATRLSWLILGTHLIPVRDEMWGGITNENAADEVALWTSVARHAPEDLRAPAYSLASFAAWQTGNGSLGMTLADYALADTPDYSMARLMLDLYERGVNPKTWAGIKDRVLEGETNE